MVLGIFIELREDKQTNKNTEGFALSGFQVGDKLYLGNRVIPGRVYLTVSQERQNSGSQKFCS